jgi:hypothetical protein
MFKTKKEGKMNALDELIKELKDWFYGCSAPIKDKRAYNECPICGCTWWADKEKARHNFGCWIPLLFSDLRDEENVQLRARIVELEDKAKRVVNSSAYREKLLDSTIVAVGDSEFDELAATLSEKE